MNRFLNFVIDHSGDPQGLRDQVFVFPTRRAGVIFRNLLLQRFPEEVFFAPDIRSIEDFVQTQSTYIIPHELELVRMLYEAYVKLEPGLPFDEFYPWGTLLIRDFDEVDRYLADGRKLYKNLSELREVDSIFIDDEEVKRIVSRFF